MHFDCVYRGITAVSSRESKLLAGNRIIAQVICLNCSVTICQDSRIILCVCVCVNIDKKLGGKRTLTASRRSNKREKIDEKSCHILLKDMKLNIVPITFSNTNSAMHVHITCLIKSVDKLLILAFVLLLSSHMSSRLELRQGKSGSVTLLTIQMVYFLLRPPQNRQKPCTK